MPPRRTVRQKAGRRLYGLRLLLPATRLPAPVTLLPRLPLPCSATQGGTSLTTSRSLVFINGPASSHLVLWAERGIDLRSAARLSDAATDYACLPWSCILLALHDRRTRVFSRFQRNLPSFTFPNDLNSAGRSFGARVAHGEGSGAPNSTPNLIILTAPSIKKST